MKKKFLALVLTLAMVLSLVPVTALATEGTPDTASGGVVDGYYTNTGEWKSGELENAIPGSLKDTVTTVDKTAEKLADNQYKVTLKVQMKQKKTDVPPGAAATVLVIDTSGSMNDCTKEEHQHTDDCYQWAECTPQVNPRHYRSNGSHKKYNTICKYEDGRYIYPASQTCGKEEHEHNSDNCKAPYRIDAAKEAARNFLNSYRGGTVSNGNWDPSTTPLKRYVSIVSFNIGASKSNWVDVSTQDGYNTAIRSIEALSANGGTNLDAGLRMANAQLNNNTVKNMPANVVVLTDGKPTYYLGNQNYIYGDYYWGPNTRWVEVGEITYRVHGNGSQCNDATYTTTVSTAKALKQAASVYTVCFGASNEKLEAKDKPTVSEFLKTKIATQQAEGKYAYDANNATELYKAFAAISSSVVSGLNTGTVEDALPNGVSCTDATFGEDRTLTWELKAGDAQQSAADSDGFITYTYEKKYTVKIDPKAEDLKVVEGGYVPLNQPTTLTVQNGSEKVKIPFPIPAGKVTYSLTNFKKELVTKSDTLSFDTNGFIIPDTKDSTVTVGENGVTLLYKITVQGNPGAKFTVRDDGATLVSPDTIADGEDSTFSGTVGTTGETVFYVSKQFTKRDISSDTHTVSNTATIDPGDNTNGLQDNETAVTTPAKEPDPQTYTVTYQWADENRPSDATLPTGNPFILKVGQKHTVKPVPKSNVTTNAGKTGSWTCTWDATSNEIQGNAGENIIIKGTWSFQETVAPKDTLTVIKKVEGRTLDQLDQDKFKITVKGPSDYSKDLSLTDTGVTKDESKLTATWTISDLPTGTYTVSEENADVKGYDCTATYSATNGATVIVNSNASAVQNQPTTDTQASQKVTVTKGQTSTMTVTNKYKKQEVEPTPDTSKPDVNKTATNLANDKTDVTLSVGGKSAKENVAVMFLLDKSTSQGVRDEAAEMLDELATKTNTNIMYDVVIFSGTASSSGWQDIQDSTTLDAIKDNFVGSNPTDGTNMSAGILKAKSDIASLKNTHKEYTEIYLITLSDGITYVWSEVDQGKVYSGKCYRE